MKADDTDPASINFRAQLRMLQVNGDEVLSRLRNIEIEVRSAVDAQERQQFAVAELVREMEPAPNGHADGEDIQTQEGWKRP